MQFLSKKKQFRVSVFLFLIMTLVISVNATGLTASNVKNVIVLVMDGTGSTHTTLTRWYKGGPLALDEMIVGGVRTYCSNSIITDSAPAATAFATGFKSDSKFISVLPSEIDVPTTIPIAPEDKFRPVATVLEAAKLLGKSTGIIATSNIQHATPACYSSHWPNRSDYNELAEQQVYQQINVVLGGGKQYLLPKSQGGTRDDGANLIEELKKMGYDFVENTAQMKNSSANKVWGMFANDAMAYDMDRDALQEPSLAEMTRKAIDILSKNKNGFFLFVEGSKIDWASHANDPVGVISDTLAFDAAVKTALDFAKVNRNTLVLAFTDHGNGGMSIGSTATDKNYDTLKLKSVIDPLKKAILTGEGIEKFFNNDKSNITQVMNTYYGISDLTPEEIEVIKAAKPGTVNSVVGPMISKRSGIGWTTVGHTGEDVFMYAYGPGKPFGLIDNTEIAKCIDNAMSLKLNDVSKKLFVNASNTELLWGVRRNIAVAGKNWGDFNPFVVLTNEKNGRTGYLQASTNIMYLNNKPVTLNGLTYIINGVPYVPQQAINILTGVK